MYAHLKTRFNLARFGSTLKARALRGGVWLAGGSVAEQTIRFARNLILVRLLAPSTFGTMAIVLSVTSVLTAFTEVGVREALIQNPRGTERRYVESAWWMAFGRALATYLCLFIAAPWVARFYGNPDLSLLLRVALLGLLFEGATSAQAYVRLKEMRFSKWALIQNGGGILGIVITVALSFMLRNIWALVLGFCAESAIRCLLSYVMCPFFPALRWDREAVKDLVSFSRKLFGLSVLHLIFLRADIFVLAKIFSSADLGVYSMAVFLAQVPAGFLIGLMGQVLMPTLSEIQRDKERMNRIILQTSTAIAFLGLPTAAFLLLFGKPLLALVYGPIYATAGLSLALAGCIALISMMNVQLTSMFYASGHPNLHRRCVAVMAATVVVLIYPMAKWMGLVGGQVAALVGMIAGFVLQASRAKQVTDFKASQYAAILSRSAVYSLPVPLVWIAGKLLLPPTTPLISAALGLFGFVLSCVIAGWSLVGRSLRMDREPSGEVFFAAGQAEQADL